MKLGAICSAPCFPGAGRFDIPPPGSPASSFGFGRDGDRDFFAVLLNNHPPASRPEAARVAIVGLSPAATQIEEFVTAYQQTGDYGQASVAGAFAGLSGDIIAMFRGLGLAEKLGLTFSHGALAKDPEIHVTSLVACASLSLSGSSDAFAPERTPAAVRCVADRFVNEMLSADFPCLTTVVILGKHAWRAVEAIRTTSGETVLQRLRSAGKTVLNVPHPSGQNREYVMLAILRPSAFPGMDEYVDRKWREYATKPARPGRGKEREDRYRAKRASYWQAVHDLRQQIAAMT